MQARRSPEQPRQQQRQSRACHPFPSPPPDPTPFPGLCPVAALIAAVKQGRVPAAEQLLGGAADPNAVDAATGETPLFLAIPQAVEQPDLLQQLLDSACVGSWASAADACRE